MKYKNKVVSSGETRFTDAPLSDIETSRFSTFSHNLTTMNAGDIVPVYCAEVLPRDTFSQVVNFAIRQSTLLKPTMGNMELDLYAFFVPNRIINESWKNVMGENSSGSWSQDTPVTLAPLVGAGYSNSTIQVPVGSVADYYGFPTQAKIPKTLLQQCNDLKFRGYLEIYNTYFRSEAYEPVIPYSKLNVYNGFFEPLGTSVGLAGTSGGTAALRLEVRDPSSGSYGAGAVAKAVYGEGDSVRSSFSAFAPRKTSFSALGAPLKANKKHDYFTSCLPSPQKGGAVTFHLADSSLRVPLATETDMYPIKQFGIGENTFGVKFGYLEASTGTPVMSSGYLKNNGTVTTIYDITPDTTTTPSTKGPVKATNIVGEADLSSITAIDLATLRDGAALQQVYECLARGGSRYREFVNSFFGLDVDDTLKDIPTYLGHVSRDLDLYQTAQTSASETGSTPQGNLTGFGYTDSSAQMFAPFTFPEHGYVHVLAVVRQRNIYPSYLSPDNFRLGMTDFYLPQLANISEQPVRTAYINPFLEDITKIFGYQEAWAEYRYEPNRVSGFMRPGISESLSSWNYADEFNSALSVLDGTFLKSNAQAVLDRTLAVTSEVAPQFICDFAFATEKQRPMPIYSIPGLDII